MATKKRKTTLKEARAKEAAKHEKKIAEQEKKIAELETQTTGQPIPKKTEEERTEAKKITLHHKFRPNALRFANYIIQKPEYGYYWHDTTMVERQGWGIWERVDESNHKGCILPNTRKHADGSIRVGTAFMCYAPIEDVRAQRAYQDQRTDSKIPGLKEAYLEEEKRIAGQHYGGIGTAFGEGIEEKQIRY